MVSQTRCKIIIFFRLHQIKLNLSSDIPVFFCFQHCFTTQNNASLPLPSRSNRKPDAFPAIATTLPTARQSINQTCQRTPSQIRLRLVPGSVASRPRFGRASPQIRLRLIPGSLSNRGSLTEVISLSPEMVIPPSLPSIIRNTDCSILWNKNDWILHNFERHFSNITNRHSFPFNTDCLTEYQTSPLTNSPPEQSGQSENSVAILLSGYSFVSLRHETMASITDSIS